MQLLVTGTIPDEFRLKFEALGFDIQHYEHSALVDESKFCTAIKDASVYISGGYEVASKKVIEAATHLRQIIFLGSDYAPYIDVATATARNITICNTLGSNSNSVAEFTIGLLLAAARRIPSLVDAVRAGSWSCPTTNDLRGKTIGLIGFGNVASKVAKIASSGFGLRVLCWTRNRARISPEMFEYRDLHDLMPECDFLSLHVPAQSIRLLEYHFKLMRHGVILINTAPADLVDPDSLYQALVSGSVACAAFDGFYHEGKGPPQGIVKQLLELPKDKLIVTPHAAWRTKDTDIESYKIALANVVSFFDNGTAPNAVNTISQPSKSQ